MEPSFQNFEEPCLQRMREIVEQMNVYAVCKNNAMLVEFIENTKELM